MGKLEIKDLQASIEGQQILRGVNLTINPGEVHAVMGPNGSGKSTLAYALMGHPKYEITGGEVIFDGEDVLAMAPDERAKKGVFLAFQYPQEIPGVSLSNFMRTAYNAVNRPEDDAINPMEFTKLLEEKMKLVDMDPVFADRYLNEGFSGGEKKKCEMLQMALLEPHFAVLDETDSGLDIDALRVVANAVESLRGPEFSALLITRYQRILNYVKPDFVHVMYEGKLVRSGGPELAAELEEKGYDWIKEEVAV